MSQDPYIEKIEHIGIAVKDIVAANDLYTKLLGTGPYKMETVDSELVITSFFQVGESKIELVCATEENSPIYKFINHRGPGVHHIAFAVKDIIKSMEYLKEQGFKLINDMPKRGADNKWVCFVHPKSVDGVLIELCQDVLEE